MKDFKPEKIHIDLETYSSVDLKKCGVHKYAKSLDFEIMLITVGYVNSFGRRVYETYEVANGDRIPEYIVKWLQDKSIKKLAFNAAFERVCLSNYFDTYLHPSNWECVMVMSGYYGLPMSLGEVSSVLELDNVKLAGTALINYFAVPCKKTKANGMRCRNLPKHSPDKWEDYVNYNIADVATEMDVYDYLIEREKPIPADVWGLYTIDQIINDRGVLIDTYFAKKAMDLADKTKLLLTDEIEKLTGISNGNSASQLTAWFMDRLDDVEDVKAETIRNIINSASGLTKKIAVLREQSSRTASKKYTSAIDCADFDDDRARGLFAFYGANRTGRFAGRRMQLQNMQRISFAKNPAEIEKAREHVKTCSVGEFNIIYPNAMDVLGQLTRTTLIAGEHNIFFVADYSAIEARVLAWLAGENWKLEVFRTHGKIYEATASRMFGVPFADIGKDSPYRQRGKVAELAFGYGGSIGAVKKMGFLNDGTLCEDEVYSMVKLYRRENKNIVNFWADLEEIVVKALHYRGEVFQIEKVKAFAGVEHLYLALPSGRCLTYYKPLLTSERGRVNITYEGDNNLTGKRERIDTYGGKLCENVTQAVAADVLLNALKVLSEQGYDIVLHVHDEIVCEVSKTSEKSLEDMCLSMCELPVWAEGLPLSAEGYTSTFYRK